jgi:sugar fermentation stimulation protein A
MKFPDPLIRGTLARRYKRFLADVVLEDGATVVAHVANSGSMLGLTEPGSEVWISPARNPDRKLKFTWELIRDGRSLVGINTSHPNALVAGAIKRGKIPELADKDQTIRREVKYGKNSRIDILLEKAGRKTYVEVKNVHLSRQKGLAEFPDSVTARGAKHLVELGDMVAQGHRAVMVYLVQRQDAKEFSIAGDIDPTYAETLKTALSKGVEALCYRCKMTTKSIVVDKPVAMKL